MNLMKKLNLILVSFLSIIYFLNFNFSFSVELSLISGKAIIIDGDTIKIKGETIRFGGIDTPEKKQIGHIFSKIKLQNKIKNKIITCVRESEKDRWGRTIAECFVKDQSISSFMVKNGYACDYVKYSNKKFAKEQLHAKSKKLGIWKMDFDTSWEKKCG